MAGTPTVPASAQLPDLESRAQTLRNGEYVWADRNQTGQVAIVVSLADQIAYVYRGGSLIGISTVSTGKPGKSTPAGEFTILQKKVFHRSNLYSNAPMPYMQRLTWSGIALHAGHLPGYPASHGCIRFPAAFAKQLYAITAMGGAVRVVPDLPGGPARPQPRELPPVRMAAAPSAPAARPQAPVLVADTRGALRHDDEARAGAESAAPRIEVAAETASFASYDAVFSQGYGARGAD